MDNPRKRKRETTRKSSGNTSKKDTSTKREDTSSGDQNSVSKSARYHCNYCSADISSEVRIKCAICQDFDLCVDCFFVGVETGKHKNYHSYRVMDDMSTPLFSKTWGAEEELLLLEGIEMFGLGNWTDVAEHVGTKKPIQCEYHYWTTYVDVPTYPLPNSSKGVVDDENVDYDNLVHDQNGMLVNKKEKQPFAKPKKKKDLTTGAEVGYIPLRGDFDVEYENDFELLIAEMDIHNDDPPEEKELKIKMLKAYDFILTEREKRKKFCAERGLIDFKRIQGLEKKRSKEERDLFNKFRPFARFVSPQQFSDLMQSLLQEQKLRQRIKQLQEYRKNGICTIAQGEQYDLEKRRRDISERSYIYRGVSRSRYRSGFVEDESPLKKPLLDINAAPSVEMLSLKERELCSNLRITPKQYMAVKDTLLREAFKLGTLTKATAYKLVGLDMYKVGRLYDFFVDSGWIKT